MISPDGRAALAAQLALERRVQALLIQERENAEEETALAIRLCTGASLSP